MADTTDKKITLYADILKETASCDGGCSIEGFGLPAEEDRQRDLQYIVAVLVSSGMNLNGAVFLPSELVAARNTMLHKPLDVEHLEGYVIGHIHSRAFMTKDRSIVDPVGLFAELGNKIDREDLDIAVLMSLYKYRFPDLANEVEEGKYKVSMECYFKSFDIKVGDIIISKDEARALGIKFEGSDSHVGSRVSIIEPGKEKATTTIGRVFRDIMFSGCGLVEYPANPDSDILEAASGKPSAFLEDVIIDMSKSETYMKNKQETEAIEVSPAPAKEVVDPKDASNFGGAVPASPNPGTCVSFKKYVYSYQPDSGADWDQEHPPHIEDPPGAGDSVGPKDKIVKEHWCSLFDVGCTSFAGDATNPQCLRNVLNRSTKDAVSDHQDFLDELRWSNETWDAVMSLKDKTEDVKDFLSKIKK